MDVNKDEGLPGCCLVGSLMILK